VTDSIREIRARSIVTADGVEREIDAIVFGTGFRVQDLPIAKRVRGRTGRTLAETWAVTMKAHLGTTVAEFPNLFILQGPNTGLGHTSVITMIESQIEHLVGALRYMKEKGLTALEPRKEAQEAFVSGVDAKMARTVWTNGNCTSWYLDKGGRNSTLWPGFTFTFRRRVASFRPSEYEAAR
jgi:cation diffusion facilitator CzcD-associated flavoprotein CzcO